MKQQGSILIGTTKTSKGIFFQKVLVVIAIVVVIGGALTGVMTYANSGVSDQFLKSWLSSFVLAVLVMAPCGFVLMKALNSAIDSIFHTSTKSTRNIIVGVSMALVMEAIMSAVTTANNVGIRNISTFIDKWLSGYVMALPLGLTMAVVMALILKPKLEQFMAS